MWPLGKKEKKPMIDHTDPGFDPTVQDTGTPEETDPREVTADRSIFNCPDCKGEGLLNQHSQCPRCHGTGKV
jgi:DnaJ-class molecular chaperone